jgi:hypothetical protein
MSNREVDPKAPYTQEEEETATGGINLTLVYSLLALALAAAILFAVFIVYPFYIRR